MPSGGRNKKPTALRLLEGNPGKRPLPANEPKPSPKAPKCPAWLPKEAKRKWKELAPKLGRLGLLTELDGEKLTALCLHWSIMVAATKDVTERGNLVPSAREDGAMVKNPSLQILRDNSAAFDRFATGFGLDPVNRSRIVLPAGPEETDGIAALFAGLKGKK